MAASGSEANFGVVAEALKRSPLARSSRSADTKPADGCCEGLARSSSSDGAKALSDGLLRLSAERRRLALIEKDPHRRSEQEASERRQRDRARAARSRQTLLKEAKRFELAGRLDLGVIDQQVGRAFVQERLSGSHLRMRRGTIFEDRRVKLPEDMRATGREIVDLACRAEQLVRVRGSLDDVQRGDRDRPILDPWRSSIIAADRLITKIRSDLGRIPATAVSLSQWDLIDLFALQGWTLGALARGKGLRRDAVRDDLISSLRSARPLLAV